MGLRIAFWIDPLESLRFGHDTTLAIMLEAQAAGHEVSYFETADLMVDQGRCRLRLRRVRLFPDAARRASILSETREPLSDLDVVFLRKDPPVDRAYAHATRMLEMCGPERRPLLINNPSALRDMNEKLYALHFPELCPRTLVTRDLVALREFREEVGDIVVKPLDGFGGQGVFVVRRGDPNAAAIFEAATQQYTQPAVAQEFLPAAAEGDKRILLLDGEPLGAILRRAPMESFRCNLAQGGTAHKASLSESERELCRVVGADLRQRGLYFVGIDVIGERLTEINITSPTGIVEMDHAERTNLETEIIRFVERRASAPQWKNEAVSTSASRLQ